MGLRLKVEEPKKLERPGRQPPLSRPLSWAASMAACVLAVRVITSLAMSWLSRDSHRVGDISCWAVANHVAISALSSLCVWSAKTRPHTHECDAEARTCPAISTKTAEFYAKMASNLPRDRSREIWRGENKRIEDPRTSGLEHAAVLCTPRLFNH